MILCGVVIEHEPGPCELLVIERLARYAAAGFPKFCSDDFDTHAFQPRPYLEHYLSHFKLEE